MAAWQPRALVFKSAAMKTDKEQTRDNKKNQTLSPCMLSPQSICSLAQLGLLRAMHRTSPGYSGDSLLHHLLRDKQHNKTKLAPRERYRDFTCVIYAKINKICTHTYRVRADISLMQTAQPWRFLRLWGNLHGVDATSSAQHAGVSLVFYVNSWALASSFALALVCSCHCPALAPEAAADVHIRPISGEQVCISKHSRFKSSASKSMKINKCYANLPIWKLDKREVKLCLLCNG